MDIYDLFITDRILQIIKMFNICRDGILEINNNDLVNDLSFEISTKILERLKVIEID